MPEIKGERIVYRSWNITEDLELKSTGHGNTVWEKTMHARCRQGVPTRLWADQEPAPVLPEPPHPSPHINCDCGLYGIYDVARVPAGEQQAIGAIAVSGDRVELGPTGVRAQTARIVLLGYTTPKNKVIIQAVANKYGLPSCQKRDLEHLAMEFGQPVPKNERPDGPEAYIDLAIGGSINVNQIGQSGFAQITFGVGTFSSPNALKPQVYSKKRLVAEHQKLARKKLWQIRSKRYLWGG